MILFLMTQLMAAATLTPDQAVEQLYVRCLSRKPTPEELAALGPLVNGQEKPEVALQDFFWALMNSREFLFNH